MSLLIASVLLMAFAILAVIDGFYLHILKYQLFNHKESKFEHLTHTLRAILFPLIVYFLFVKQNCITGFYIGVFFLIVDIVVLTIDAFAERDSRTFMGGLPRWEYILHLFVNGFHFASIAVFLSLKLTFKNNRIEIVQDLSNYVNFEFLQFIATNLIPGAILLALLHIVTSFSQTKSYWNRYRNQIKCC